MKEKKRHLQELLSHAVMYRSLVARNKRDFKFTKESRIALPFIIVNTKHQTKINLEMSEDRQDIFFNFSHPFEIHDYNEILKSLNLPLERDKVQSAVPPEMLHLLPTNMYPPTPAAAATESVGTPAATGNKDLYSAENRNSETFDGATCLLTMRGSPRKR